MAFLPILASIALAFFRWDIITDPQFVGLDNFAQIAADPTIRVSFLNTIAFVIIAVTLQLALALGLAVLVNTKMPALLRSFFRSVLFFPLILSAASVSIIMGYLFNENFGLVNHVLNLLGMAKVPWLTSTHGGDDRGHPRVRLAELRLLLPAVPGRPVLDPQGGL